MPQNSISRPSPFINSNDLKQLNQIAEKSCNGFFLAYDIEGSTKRKEEYKYHSKWVEQTALFYRAFNKLNTRIAKDCNLTLTVEKFIGDGVMSFFKESECKSNSENEQVDLEKCKSFVKHVIGFKNEVESQDFLCNMKLKTVLTYLTDVHLIHIEDKKKDILGRGIDFSFRLESFASSSHIVINHFFYKNLFKANPDFIKINSEDYFVIKTQKVIKGWNNPQEFYGITNVDMIADMLENLKNDIYDKTLISELFKEYVKVKKSNDKVIPIIESKSS